MSRRKRTTISPSTTFSEGYEQFMLRCRAKNLRENTIKTYEQHLNQLRRFLIENQHPMLLAEITTNDLRLYIAELMSSGVSDVTVASRVRTVKVFFNFLASEEILPDNPVDKLEKIKVDEPGIFVLNAGQIKRLLKQPDQKQFAGFRDYVIMCVMLDTGIRLSELLSLRIKDYVGSHFILEHTKNRKRRVLPVGKRLQELMNKYLAIRAGDPNEYLFCNVLDEHLKPRTLQERIKNYGKQANIEGVRVSPHTLRHTFATQYLLNGGDMVSLQEILGHSSLEMVRRYVNYLHEDIQRQHKKFSPLDRF